MTSYSRLAIARFRRWFPAARAALLSCVVVGMVGGCADDGLSRADVQSVPSGAGGVELAVVKLDWHTEIGMPLDRISGPLVRLLPVEPNDRYLIVGFGDKAYFTDHDAGSGTAFAALFPGPSAVQVAAFEQIPEDATHIVVRVRVSREGLDRMTRFVWESLDKRGDGAVRRVSENNPRSVFFEGHHPYEAFYNCNAWTADALKAGGLPFDPAGTLFASGVMDRARSVASAQGKE